MGNGFVCNAPFSTYHAPPNSAQGQEFEIESRISHLASRIRPKTRNSRWNFASRIRSKLRVLDGLSHIASRLAKSLSQNLASRISQSLQQIESKSCNSRVDVLQFLQCVVGCTSYINSYLRFRMGEIPALVVGGEHIYNIYEERGNCKCVVFTQRIYPVHNELA